MVLAQVGEVRGAAPGVGLAHELESVGRGARERDRVFGGVGVEEPVSGLVVFWNRVGGVGLPKL